jgi:hypothetical protein
MAFDFDAYVADVRKGVATLAKKEAADYVDAIRKDTKSFLHESRDDLERWTALLASGDLEPREFRLLVHAEKTLGEMKALRAAAKSEILVQKIANGILDVVVQTAFAAIA